MTIQIQHAGRRYYLRGDTFSVRDQLRNAGFHWDGEARAWWTGKADEAERMRKRLAGVPSEREQRYAEQNRRERENGLDPEQEVLGRASYKGRSYLLVWEGDTRRGPAAKLAFSDGSKVFWANQGEYEVERRYRAPVSIGRLQELREEARQARAQGFNDGIPAGRRHVCEECGEWVTRDDGSRCWETGAGH
jgi:hypothetical protein